MKTKTTQRTEGPRKSLWREIEEYEASAMEAEFSIIATSDDDTFEMSETPVKVVDVKLANDKKTVTMTITFKR